MKRVPLIKIVLTDQIDIYDFNTKTIVSVQGKYGTAALSILPGTWRFSELKKPLTGWQKILKFLRLHKDKHFIRAQRVR